MSDSEAATKDVGNTFDIDKAQSQMRKGFLEFPVLLIIGSGATYAPDILAKLKDANLLVVEGTLYPLLSRLRRYGLLDYVWQESTGGPPRKVYSLTKSGEGVLAALETSWGSFTTSINTLIKQYETDN